MKKISFVLLSIIAMLCLIGPAPAEAKQEITHEYPETFIVRTVNHEADFILLETFSGNQFIWNNSEDWEENDIAAAIMDSNGTETVIDDKIIMLQYAGWID